MRAETNPPDAQVLNQLISGFISTGKWEKINMWAFIKHVATVQL